MVQASQAAKRAADVKAIDTRIEAESAAELAQRNEATAMRQNQNAMLNREGTRIGGGRYRRRGLFTPGGSGLDKANSQALVSARKNAAYANLEAQDASQKNAELQNAWRRRVNTIQYFY
jgi:hypothetical protein